MQAEARRDLEGFLSRIERGRPHLTLKLAASLDGRIATGTGESRWITGPQARARVHMMRARHDAVMVGGGTARADDPMLNVRGLGIDRQPVRVVLSRRLDLSRDGALARSARDMPLWLCHEAAADAAPWRALGAVSLPCAVAGGQLDPAAVLAELGAAGLTRVFCEGGAGLAASLLGAGLVDELVLFTAGCAIGAEGTPALSVMGIDRLSQAPRLRLVAQERVGEDAMTVWRRG